MAAKPQKINDSKKRKTSSSDVGGKSNPKKFKPSSTTSAINHKGLKKVQYKGPKKPFKQDGKLKASSKKPFDVNEHVSEKVIESKRDARKRSKELGEARKMKRKKHYSLEKELGLLWDKMRQRDIAKEERSKLSSNALQKMKGKIIEIASSHLSSRVLQSCVKFCTPEERSSVFMELKPHLLSMSLNTYAVHLVTKLLDFGTKEELNEFISTIHSHVAKLLRHMVGSLAIEHAYHLGNASQKQALLMELYSPELQIFKDLTLLKENKLENIISKLKLQKSAVIRHIGNVLQPILEKGIIDHSIVHRVLMEYFFIAEDKSDVIDVMDQLIGAGLVRIVHTKDGSRLAMFCIKYGSAKGRKRIIKALKDHVYMIARDKYGNCVLVSLFSIVDDTKLVSKYIISGLLETLKSLIFDKFGRCPILHLLHPYCLRYFSADNLTSFNLSIPSLSSSKEVSEVDKSLEEEATVMKDKEENINEGGKKDPLIRRKELLINSGLAEKLISACSELAEYLLKSKFGKDVIYEVAMGGGDGILLPKFSEELKLLYEVISELVLEPKLDGTEEEHLLEQYHSSRMIRKLIIDCPAFAKILWETALKGRCSRWAKGHSGKVISGFMESSVREDAKKEIQPLIDSGVLQPYVPADKEADNE